MGSPDVPQWAKEFVDEFCSRHVPEQHNRKSFLLELFAKHYQEHAARSWPQDDAPDRPEVRQVVAEPTPEAAEFAERIKAAGKYGCDGCYQAIREITPLVAQLEQANTALNLYHQHRAELEADLEETKAILREREEY